MKSDGGATLLSTGAVASALAASLCCLGPLFLAILGLGGGALFLKLEAYRPYFAVATAILLGGALYLAYRPAGRDECAEGSTCTDPRPRRRARVVVGVAFAVVLLLIALNFLSQHL